MKYEYSCVDCKWNEDWAESGGDVVACRKCFDYSKFEPIESIPDQSNVKYILDITMADDSKHHVICFGSPVVHDNWLICQVDESGVRSRSFNINYIACWNIQPLNDNEEVLLN